MSWPGYDATPPEEKLQQALRDLRMTRAMLAMATASLHTLADCLALKTIELGELQRSIADGQEAQPCR